MALFSPFKIWDGTSDPFRQIHISSLDYTVNDGLSVEDRELRNILVDEWE